MEMEIQIEKQMPTSMRPIATLHGRHGDILKIWDVHGLTIMHKTEYDKEILCFFPDDSEMEYKRLTPNHFSRYSKKDLTLEMVAKMRRLIWEVKNVIKSNMPEEKKFEKILKLLEGEV